MNIFDWVIVSIILVALLLLFVICVEGAIPAFVRTEFDKICDRYLSMISIYGGLSTTDKNNLTEELNDLGLINITITAPEEEDWGSEGSLQVTAYYDHETANEDYSRERTLKVLEYNNSTAIFGLEN